MDRLVEFLRAEQPDVVTMQEVSGGDQNFWSDHTLDIFAYLKMELGLVGVCAPAHNISGRPDFYFGNAVLIRGSVLDHAVLWLRPYREYLGPINYIQEGPTLPRNAVDVVTTVAGVPVHIVSTHGAWTEEPVDTPEKIRQAKALAHYLESLDAPFVLGGDFNMPPGSAVVSAIDAVAKNAVSGSAIQNTLNLRTHRAATKLSSGLLVDFIYTSPHFKVVSIDTPQVDVSDHLPVRAVLTMG